MTATDWNPDYQDIIEWRNRQLIELDENPYLAAGAIQYYKTNPIEFIEHWVSTYDPRNAGTGKPTRMPFMLFDRQKEMVTYLYQLIDAQEHGLIEKARDMGATWVSCAVSVHLFLFYDGASIGWGSRKSDLVDKLGDLDSIFEKMRMIFRSLPKLFLPEGFSDDSMSYMKIINPANGSTITGESGDNIGRGGRSLIYFKDEAAHYDRPEKIEAALADNTNIQIDISSVNGLGNVFHRRREAGEDWDGEVVKDTTNVFVMDWSDHPLKDQSWYDKRRAKAESEGMLHVFEQEVNRNYAASVEGVLIPQDWVRSATDAHLKLKWKDVDFTEGGYISALDVADEGMDRNAQATRKGVVLQELEEWGERDTGQTARKAVASLGIRNVVMQYDSIGVGAGVKAETNRLMREGLLSKRISLVPWNAGASVENPDEHVLKGDSKSPINKDFYKNLKAQAGWQLRLRFERTHKAVTEGIQYRASELISIDSTIPLLKKLQKELSQPTTDHDSRMKLMINKTPEGTKSPNLADAVVMCYFPIKEKNRAPSVKRAVGGTF